MGGYHAYGIHPDRLFGVGALAPRGLPPFIGGLCGDHSPHRTTMTQTKRCPIFKFGSWWCFSRQSPQESDCEINASFAQGCGCVINASRRCGIPVTGCCGTGPCLDQSSDGITEPQGQAGLSWRRLATTSNALFHLPFAWCCWPCSWKYHPRSFSQSFGSSCCFKYLQGLGPLGMGFNPVQCQGIFGRSTAIRAIPQLFH